MRLVYEKEIRHDFEYIDEIIISYLLSYGEIPCKGCYYNDRPKLKCPLWTRKYKYNAADSMIPAYKLCLFFKQNDIL